jgi:hypothetical protein
LIWVETQFAAWLSYRHTAIVLQSLLPLESAIAASSIKAKTRVVGQRLEAEWDAQTWEQLLHRPERCHGRPTQAPGQGPQIDAGYIKTIPGTDKLNRHRLGVVLARSFVAEGDGVPLALISDAGNDIQNAI